MTLRRTVYARAGLAGACIAACSMLLFPPLGKPAAARTTREGISASRAGDVHEIIRQMIDLPALQQYYHTRTESGRVPLIVAGRQVPRTLHLRKFGQRVLVRGADGAGARPFLHFERIQLRGATADVRFSYAVEGVGVRARLVKRTGRWTVARAQLWER